MIGTDKIAVRVVRKQREAEDIVSLELRHADGESLPAFSAGAHIDLHIKPDLVRQYSLYNHPAEQHRYMIGVLRDPASRGGSVAIHDEIGEGDLIPISAPRNNFQLARARRSMLFAGGIGVTPLLSMAQQLAQACADFELHYCTRTPARTAFRERITANGLSKDVHFHFDDGDEYQQLQLNELLDVPDHSTHLYICGPVEFNEHVCRTAEDCGWRAKNVHYEYFSAEARDGSDDRPFEVEIASSGEIIPVPADQAVTQALQMHGIDIEVVCEQGVCGTCVTGVLEGEPEHHDRFLSTGGRERNDRFTPCCSRARSDRLVLDL